VLEETLIARGDGFSVADVRCSLTRPGFDAPEQ